MVDLEFLTERVSRLPTRKEQALKPLYDGRKRRDSYRLDRAFLAALPLSHANLLEPHSSRLATRHCFHCHAMSAITNSMALDLFAC